MDLLPLGDLHAETVLVFRYLFAEIARYEAITALIEKESASVPALGQRFWDEIAEPGYQLGVAGAGPPAQQGRARRLGRRSACRPAHRRNQVNFRRAQWTFGQLALDVEEERLIQVIARVLQTLAAAR